MMETPNILCTVVHTVFVRDTHHVKVGLELPCAHCDVRVVAHVLRCKLDMKQLKEQSAEQSQELTV